MLNNKKEASPTLSFKDAIDFNPLTASPEILLAEALQLLSQGKKDCLLPNLRTENLAISSESNN